MSGAFPTTPGPREVVLRPVYPVAVSRAQSGRRFSRLLGGHYWVIEASWAPLTRAEFAPIEAFLMSQQGAFDSFTFIHPTKKTPLGVATGTPVTSGGNVGNTLNTSGWTPSISSIMKAGDLILIAGDAKVYMVGTSVNSGSTGLATLIVYPSLMVSPVAGSAITVINVPFTVSIAEVYEVRARAMGIVDSFSITFEEHIIS